jgi:hypothetical protein
MSSGTGILPERFKNLRRNFHAPARGQYTGSDCQSNFQKGGDSLRGIQANRQVCAAFSEIAFGN